MIIENDLQAVAAALQSPRLKLLLEHWQNIRGDRLMPAWRDIDALVLAPIMPILWSWKYDRATATFTGRLAGEEINAIFGKPLRNARMEDFFRGWDYENIYQRHHRVVCDPSIVIGHGLVFSHAGRQGHGERLILPLADDGYHGDGLIGATTYALSERPTRRPSDDADTPSALSLPISNMGEDVHYFPLRATRR
jgi:hypothetical protein